MVLKTKKPLMAAVPPHSTPDVSIHQLHEIPKAPLNGAEGHGPVVGSAGLMVDFHDLKGGLKDSVILKVFSILNGWT